MDEDIEMEAAPEVAPDLIVVSDDEEDLEEVNLFDAKSALCAKHTASRTKLA
jgi:hypothetical protein